MLRVGRPNADRLERRTLIPIIHNAHKSRINPGQINNEILIQGSQWSISQILLSTLYLSKEFGSQVIMLITLSFSPIISSESSIFYLSEDGLVKQDMLTMKKVVVVETSLLVHLYICIKIQSQRSQVDVEHFSVSNNQRFILLQHHGKQVIVLLYIIMLLL